MCASLEADRDGQQKRILEEAGDFGTLLKLVGSLADKEHKR